MLGGLKLDLFVFGGPWCTFSGLKFSLRLWTQRKLTSPTVFCINNSYTVMLVQAAVKSSCTVAVSSRQFYNVNYVLREIRDIGVPDRVHPGRGTKGLKSGTSRIIRDGWQPYWAMGVIQIWAMYHIKYVRGGLPDFWFFAQLTPQYLRKSANFFKFCKNQQKS